MHYTTISLLCIQIKKILVTSDCAIFGRTSDRTVFWTKDSQHFNMELECNPPQVMWAGMTPTHVIGSCIFMDLLMLHFT